MDLATLKQHLLAKKAVTEDFPFGPDVAVFRVMGKMFALVPWAEDPLRVNLKCDPDYAEVLRATYPAVLPGYHMNKKHWNTVLLDGSIPESEVLQWMTDSYNLIVKSLKKMQREALAAMLDAEDKQ